jgi:hypothetical protein
MMEELFMEIKECPNCTIHTPKESYYFIPSERDEFKYDIFNPENINRFIFEKKNKSLYLSYENIKYNNFQNYLKTHSIIIPKDIKESDIRRYLQSSYYNEEKTYSKITQNINYKIPSLSFNLYEEIISSRFLYMHGLDINYCPILIANGKIFLSLIDKYPIEYFICAIDKIISYLIKHFFIPGQIENWIVIADLNEVSIWDPPLKLLKIFEFLQIKYIFRLKYLYIYGMDSILNFCYNIIKSLIDERTTNKIKFINNQNDINDIVLSNIHSSQIERKYGGDCDNLINNLKFPFILPNNDYQIEKFRKEIISEDEYLNKVKKDELCVISPYLKDKNQYFKIYDKKPTIYDNIEFYEVESIVSNKSHIDNKSNYSIKNVLTSIDNNVIFIDNYIKKDENNIEIKSENKTGVSDLKNENSENKENYNNLIVKGLKRKNNKFNNDNDEYIYNINNNYNSKNKKKNLIIEGEENRAGCYKENCYIM